MYCDLISQNHITELNRKYLQEWTVATQRQNPTVTTETYESEHWKAYMISQLHLDRYYYPHQFCETSKHLPCLPKHYFGQLPLYSTLVTEDFIYYRSPLKESMNALFYSLEEEYLVSAYRIKDGVCWSTKYIHEIRQMIEHLRALPPKDWSHWITFRCSSDGKTLGKCPQVLYLCVWCEYEPEEDMNLVKGSSPTHCRYILAHYSPAVKDYVFTQKLLLINQKNTEQNETELKKVEPEGNLPKNVPKDTKKCHTSSSTLSNLSGSIAFAFRLIRTSLASYFSSSGNPN